MSAPTITAVPVKHEIAPPLSVTRTPDTGTPPISTVPVSSNTNLANTGLAVWLVWAALLAILAIGIGAPLAWLCRPSTRKDSDLGADL